MFAYSTYHKIMQDINIRLKKIIGQISAIMKMTDEKQDCEKIITQFQAVKAAFNSAYSESLDISLQQCLKDKDIVNMKKILKLIAKK